MAAEVSEGRRRDCCLSPALGLAATAAEEGGALVQQPRLAHVRHALRAVVGTAGDRPGGGLAGRTSRPQRAGALLHPRRQTSAYLTRDMVTCC